MKFLKDNHGMELLEAAITTPIAIMVMIAIVNLGMLVYAQHYTPNGVKPSTTKKQIPLK
jgi:hypothetical protein